VFDFAIGGKVLRELLLRNDSNRGVATKQNRPRRGRALIDGEDIGGQDFLPRQPFFSDRRLASGARLCQLPAAREARRSFATGTLMCRSQRSHELMVLISSIDTVIGPTPPGTGVM